MPCSPPSATVSSKENCDMQKGLTKKLDYEKGKLKSKAANPDYRDRFAQEGEKFDHGGLPRKHLTLADAVKGDLRKIPLDDKMKAIEFYTRQLRSLRIKVDRFSVGWAVSRCEAFASRLI